MGNNSWIHPPFFSRHLVPQNVGNIICVCYFINIGLGPKKVNGLAICSKNQFRDYFIRNRLEKLVPLNWNFAPQNLKKPKEKKRPTCFQTLIVLVQSGVHPPGFSKDFPMIFHGFPTPPPSLKFRGGRGSGRQISRPGSLGRALYPYCPMPYAWHTPEDLIIVEEELLIHRSGYWCIQ